MKNAGRLMKEGGAEAVKMEGGSRIVEQVEACVKAGIPVMGTFGDDPPKCQSIRWFFYTRQEK